MTHSPAAVAAAACAPEVSTAEPCEQEAIAGGRSRPADTGAALSLCAAGELPMGAPTVATAIAGTAIAATVSVRQQWARRRSARLQRGLITAAAAATTPTATMFARGGTMHTGRRGRRRKREQIYADYNAQGFSQPPATSRTGGNGPER